MSFSDSHCHLDRPSPEMLAVVLRQAKEKQVEIVVGMGTSLESSEETVRRAQSNRGMYAAVGIHPWNAIQPDVTVRNSLTALTKEEAVVAIGEIGLDYVRNPETKQIQKELLRYELSLAREMGLPVNIHCREAHRDMMDILRQEKGPGLIGVIHGFTGDLAMLNDWLDLGFYVSIGFRGFVTNEIPSLLTAIRHIPLDRLLTETDSAGGQQPSGPMDVVQVVDKLVSLRGTTAQEIADAATTNLKHLLRL
jgi:TatD DNase family protein